MTSERKETVSRQGGVLFVGGTVLGVCLGFAAGHLSVWSRISADRIDQQASDWEPRDWLGESLLDGPESSELNALGPLSDSQQIPKPFFAKGAERLDPTSPAKTAASGPPVRVTGELSRSAQEPGGLADPSHASPIDEATRYREQITRSIIAQEMPHASAQERDVWFDALRGLEPADVKGILRMRKHVDGEEGRVLLGSPKYLSDSLRMPTVPSRDLPIPDSNHDWSQTIDCLRRVRAIRLHNLCNAETAGYQRLNPVLTDTGNSDGTLGARLVRIERRLVPGEFHETGRSLDVAIIGSGFLQVARNDQRRLTRSGRLTVDDERHLALASTSQSWRLEPPIIVPEHAGSLTIDAGGRVTAQGGDSSDETELGTIELVSVLDPSAMRYVGEGLFATTPASGPAHRLAEGGSLRQHGIERLPQSAIREEIVSLEQEERLIKELQSSAGTASVTDTWP